LNSLSNIYICTEIQTAASSLLNSIVTPENEQYCPSGVANLVTTFIQEGKYEAREMDSASFF